MIPNNINNQHIEKALQEIANKGTPPQRKSKKYDLVFNGEKYPPKYVVSLANYFTCGEYLAASEFNVGEEANSFIIDLGFDIQIKKQ